MTTFARFYIDIPTEHIDETATLLTIAGFAFSPIASMVCLPEENLLDAFCTGQDGPYVIEQINDALLQEGHSEQILLPFDQMDHQTRWDLLCLATLHTSWERDLNPLVTNLDIKKVRDFLGSHPQAAAPSPPTQESPR